VDPYIQLRLASKTHEPPTAIVDMRGTTQRRWDMTQSQPTSRQPARIGRPEKRRGRFGAASSAVQTFSRAAIVQMHEAALLLSVIATAPKNFIGGGAKSANGISPQDGSHAACSRPVLLVHGFGGDKSSWTLVANALSAEGLTIDTMTYAPVGNSVEQLADRLVAEVEKLLSRTGAQKVHLVGHSLGGVIIAQAISDPRLNRRVDTVITLGSPFGGSPWAGMLPVVDMVRALRSGSPLLRRLASAPFPDDVRWLSVTAALDIIVPGPRSMPPHSQVETVTVKGVGHLGMLLSQRVIALLAATLCVPAAAPVAA
jgi:triacylglycerol lipase